MGTYASRESFVKQIERPDALFLGSVQRQGQWAKNRFDAPAQILTPAHSRVHTHATTTPFVVVTTRERPQLQNIRKANKTKHDRGPRRRALGLLEVVHDPVARRRPGERVPHPRAAGQALDGLAPRANHSTCGAFA